MHHLQTQNAGLYCWGLPEKLGAYRAGMWLDIAPISRNFVCPLFFAVIRLRSFALIEDDRDTIVHCVIFHNGFTAEMDVMDECDIMRIEFKRSSGGYP